VRAVQAAAGLAAAALLAGCGGSRTASVTTSGTASRTTARDALIGGVPLQSARCVQWRGGSLGERQAIVRALAADVGGPSGPARGTTLSEGEAFQLFDHACASRIARQFLLYELYIRAAGFRTLGSPPPT
jgi:hypothetical protein